MCQARYGRLPIRSVPRSQQAPGKSTGGSGPTAAAGKPQRGANTPMAICDSTTTRAIPRRRGSEVRDVEATFHYMHGETPMFVVVDGVVYKRHDEQERTRHLLAEDQAAADLLDLVPEEDYARAERLLLLVLEAGSEYHNHLYFQIMERLADMLPQHRPVIEAGFGLDLPIPMPEYLRHRNCTLAEPPSDVRG